MGIFGKDKPKAPAKPSVPSPYRFATTPVAVPASHFQQQSAYYKPPIQATLSPPAQHRPCQQSSQQQTQQAYRPHSQCSPSLPPSSYSELSSESNYFDASIPNVAELPSEPPPQQQQQQPLPTSLRSGYKPSQLPPIQQPLHASPSPAPSSSYPQQSRLSNPLHGHSTSTHSLRQYASTPNIDHAVPPAQPSPQISPVTSAPQTNHGSTLQPPSQPAYPYFPDQVGTGLYQNPQHASSTPYMTSEAARSTGALPAASSSSGHPGGQDKEDGTLGQLKKLGKVLKGHRKQKGSRPHEGRDQEWLDDGDDAGDGGDGGGGGS